MHHASHQVARWFIAVATWAAAFPCAAQSPWEAARELHERIAQVRSAGPTTHAQRILLAELAAESTQDRYPSPDLLSRLAANLPHGGPQLVQMAHPARSLSQQWSLPYRGPLLDCRQLAACESPDAAEDLTEQGRALRGALDRLERRLASLGDELPAWKPYLFWSETYELPDQSDVSPERLERLKTRWTNAMLTWNDPELARTSFEVRRYIERLLRADDPAFDARASERLVELAGFLDADDPPQADDPRWAQALAEIEPYGLAPEVTTAVRRRISHPNLVVRIGPQVLGQKQPIDETFPVDQVIVGTRAVGMGRMTGELSWVPPPLDDPGGWQWVLDGRLVSHTTSVERRVQIDSRSTTLLRAQKVFHWDASGPSAVPARAAATTRIISTDISGTGPFRRRRAGAIVRATRPQAEAESAALAQQSVIQRLDREGHALLQSLRETYHDAAQEPLGMSTQFVTTVRTERHGKGLQWACWLEQPHGLAAPRPAPLADDSSVAVALHESFLERYAAIHLAGRRFTSAELAQTLARWQPTARGQAVASDTWSLAFLPDRPVKCRVHEGLFRVEFQIDEFVTPDSVYPSVSVHFALRPRMSAGRWTLVKEGAAEVYPLGYVPGSGQRLSGRQLSLRRAVSRKLESAIPKEFIVPPWEIAAGRTAVALVPRDLRAEEGWLAFDLLAPSLPSSESPR